MPITIKDVAREAGVSVSTVSKVINGHYSISEATAAHVRETMRALGYYPNASAQSFARGATRRVVLLTDLYRNIAFENPHMFEIIAGAEETLRRRGYTLELRGTDRPTPARPRGTSSPAAARTPSWRTSPSCPTSSPRC